ncbi:MAG: tetratricopeptide repeat protein [Spirochaetaceae bacterium]|jgi:tetratricopeptide (TPR) repeat protein|nr:tetratricopeptide repeat protein [Spirochaetaceae bacterium]
MITRRDKGINFYNNGDYDKAVEALLKLNIVYEDDPETAYFLGLSYTQLGNFDLAETYFDVVIRYDIHVLRVFQSSMVLSYIYSITEKFDQAIRLILQILDEGFESAQIYSTLAYCCHSSGNLSKALDYLEKAIKMEPDNPNSLNSYGFILAEEGKTTSSALDFCLRALEQNPEYGAYLDSVGWAYYKNGNISEAIKFLRRAKDVWPDDNEIESHLKIVESGF